MMIFKFLSTRWDTVRTSLWFVPLLCVLVAVILAFALPAVDQRFLEDDDALPPWVFDGSADGARSILETVAASLITITGVLFSITILVLQQASSQFTPRVIGNFMRHIGTQLVLGVFIATFLYALLVLRNVRGEDAGAEEFIPRLAVTGSIVLAAACLGLLVYFIHHMATSIQASMVIASVHQELQQDVNRLYPSRVGEPVEDVDESYEAFRALYLQPTSLTVFAESSGYVQSVEHQVMLNYVGDCRAIAILPQIGTFVVRGMPLAEISGIDELSDQQTAGVCSAFALGNERSRYQDPLFGVQQLVDIALKALSPSVNDPTTAKNAVSTLGDAVVRVAETSLPDRVRSVESGEDGESHQVYIWSNRPEFADFVHGAFSEIRRQSSTDVTVIQHLVDTLGALARSVPNVERAEPVHHELDEILHITERASFSPSDVQQVREHIERVREYLPARDEQHEGTAGW